jgi:hypothetical protein
VNATEAPKVGGYTVEPGKGGVWFLVDEHDRIASVFFPTVGGMWRGKSPCGEYAVEELIAEDEPEPQLAMARLLCGEGGP